MSWERACLALLMVESLLDAAQPVAWNVFEFTLAVGGDQNDLARSEPQKIKVRFSLWDPIISTALRISRVCC